MLNLFTFQPYTSPSPLCDFFGLLNVGVTPACVDLPVLTWLLLACVCLFTDIYTPRQQHQGEHKFQREVVPDLTLFHCLQHKDGGL